MTITCQNCGTLNPSGNNFCLKCHEDLRRESTSGSQCKYCGNAIQDNDNFCGKCGNAVRVALITFAVKTCPYCGSSTVQEDNFCRNCGNRPMFSS